MLSRIDRKLFYGELRKILGAGGWAPGQVRGLDRLIDNFERDPLIPQGRVGVQSVAYFLYTDWLETGHAFMPVRERGGAAYFIRMYGSKTARGRRLGNDSDAEAVGYAGTGDVQVTGENNFEAVEDMIRDEYPHLVEEWEARTGKTFDLTMGDQVGDDKDPLNLLDPAFSYAAMVGGVTRGLYGPKLGQYINPGLCNYRGARRCVNGTDRADEFATYCPKIEAALLRAIASVPAEPQTESAEAAPQVEVKVEAPSIAAGTPAVAIQTESTAPPQPVVGGAATDPTVTATPPIWERLKKLVFGGGLTLGGIGAAGLGIFQALAGMDRIVQIIFAVLFVTVFLAVCIFVLGLGIYYCVNQALVKYWHASPKHINVG